MRWVLALAFFVLLSADAHAAPPVCRNVPASTVHATAVLIGPDCTVTGANTVQAVTQPTHGTVVVVTGSLRYTPADQFVGTDTFTYTMTNTDGPSNTATVTVTVTALPPGCVDFSNGAGAGKPRPLSLFCTSQVNQTFAVVSGPAHGTLSLDAAAGTVVYTADADYAGPDAFTYRSSSAGGVSNTATATIAVTGRPAVLSAASATFAQAAVTPRFDPQASTVTFGLYSAPCTGAPLFTSTVPVAADGSAVSGTVNPPAGATYYWQATYSGDANNLAAAGPCDLVTIPAPQPAPGPDPQPTVDPEPLQTACGDRVTILDVARAGTRAKVTGIARRDAAGQTVTIRRSGRTVGTATVRADGTFSATVAWSAKTITYTARLGSATSRAFRYDRRVLITGRSGLTVRGRLNMSTRPKTVTLYRVDPCSDDVTQTSAKVSRTGAFSFRMSAPDEGSPYVLYRIAAKGASTQVALVR